MNKLQKNYNYKKNQFTNYKKTNNFTQPAHPNRLLCIQPSKTLDFYSNFLVKIFDATKFELFQMAADSLYFTMCCESMENIWSQRCGGPITFSGCPKGTATTAQWLMLWKKLQNNTIIPCCAKWLKFDKRTLSLFKLEFKGEGIVLLCSKSYISVSSIGNKLVHKGVNASYPPPCVYQII